MIDFFLGINNYFYLWLVVIFIIYLLILLSVKSLIDRKNDRIKKGLEIYFDINTIIPSFQAFVKLMSVILIISMISVTTNFILNKDQVYTYKVDNLNAFNYDELIEVIQKEFKPDDDKIYYHLEGNPFMNEYNETYNLSKLNLWFNIKKDNKIYRLQIYNNKNKIIIYQSLEKYLRVENVKGVYALPNEFFVSHLKVKTFVKNNNFNDFNKLIISTTKYYFYDYSSYFNEKMYFIDSSGNSKETSEDELLNINAKYIPYYVTFYQESGFKGMYVFVEIKD